MSHSKERRQFNLSAALIETFGFSPLLASLVTLFFGLLIAGALVWVMLSSPPRTVTIASGPPGSSFQRYAEQYAKELALHGVTLNIVPTSGSSDNLQRLKAPVEGGVELGFVQGGLVGDPPPDDLVSLGSISYQPLWIFYRGATRVDRLSQFAGQRLGIGATGSGVYTLSRALLEANGITGAPTTFVEQPSEEAAKDFAAGKLDVIFLMGDSAPTQTLRALIRAPGAQIFNFNQADAYVRRMSYLNKITIPRGGIDFGQNLPEQDLTLVGPTVELVAREGLNSAVSDLLLGVAQKVHGRSGMLAKRGEFPAPVEHELPLSDDAVRYYKSGKGLTYKMVSSFWLASLINRLLVVIVPLILVTVPMVRLVPVLYRWSVQIRIYRCYRPLLRLERDAVTPLTREHVDEMLHKLDGIEKDVNALRVPASFAQQFYDLRSHVAFVRQRLKSAVGA